MKKSIAITILLLLGAVDAAGFEPNGLIVFLSDFGSRGDAVAVCKGVMLSHDPKLRIVDLSHRVQPFNIREGALYLRQSARYFPRGTVFVAVIDPGVGTRRRAIVLETRDGLVVVAPDNGVASLVARDHGVQGIWEIRNPKFMRGERAPTFDGRDLFAPSAARLASGAGSPGEAGPLREQMTELELPGVSRSEGRVLGAVLLIDDPYGNVWTNIGREHLRGAFGEWPARVRARIGETQLELPLVTTFGDVAAGKPLAYFNSRDELSFAIHLGDFATTHGVEIDQPVEIRVREP